MSRVCLRQKTAGNSKEVADSCDKVTQVTGGARGILSNLNRFSKRFFGF